MFLCNRNTSPRNRERKKELTAIPETKRKVSPAENLAGNPVGMAAAGALSPPHLRDLKGTQLVEIGSFLPHFRFGGCQRSFRLRRLLPRCAAGFARWFGAPRWRRAGVFARLRGPRLGLGGRPAAPPTRVAPTPPTRCLPTAPPAPSGGRPGCYVRGDET